VESAKRALGQLEALIDDAVFLDDDTFNGMKTLAYYNQKLQVPNWLLAVEFSC